MPKNIILCSDGTGNKGGSTPDTNVFKIYNAIDINREESGREQITYYDNGVGTAKFSIMKALGGGMGVGFRGNVRDLYEFLGRNYDDGDDIYIFGFSRGAATVRAFAGMVEHCGLVVKYMGRPNELSEPFFQGLIDEAMNAYAKGCITKNKKGIIVHRDYSAAHEFRETKAYCHHDHAAKGKIKIEFMGVWDTVSALGVPQLGNFDKLVNKFAPHLFYDYEPETCVKNIYHAIAVDDERQTFTPLIWNEHSLKGGGTIEQVWFPGMHSNVGGGYNRQELASVTLEWMMKKISDHRESPSNDGGLVLKNSAITGASEDANPFGKLHDSRSGFGIFYRYKPRAIESLCENKLKEKIKIHDTVFKRMRYRTGGYTPLSIPEPKIFETTFTKPKIPEERDQPTQNLPLNTKEYNSIRSKIDDLINKRIKLYMAFIVSSIFIAMVSLWCWLNPPFKNATVQMDLWWNSDSPECCSRTTELPDVSVAKDSIQWTLNWWQEHLTNINWWLGHLNDFLQYVLPDYFEGIIYELTDQPILLFGLLIYSSLFIFIRVKIMNNLEFLQEKARIELLSLMKR